MNEKHTVSERADSQPAGPDAGVFASGRSKFPTVGDILALLGIFFVSQVIGALLARMFVPMFGDMILPEVMGKMSGIAMLICYALMLPGMLIYRSRRGGHGSIVHFSAKGLNPMLLLWGVLLIFAVGVVLEPLLKLLPGFNFESLGGGTWMLFSAVLFAPVFEELVCRGVVLESLRSKYGVVAAWFVSSLFFAVVHLQPQQVVNAFFIGMILGFLYIRTNSIWIVILLHAFNNAVAYLFVATGQQTLMFSDLITSRPLYVTVYVVSAALCVVSGWMVYRQLRIMERAVKN